jgi:hypothetical protein
MKNWSRSRGALKRGVNWKSTCSICGKPIANRMVMNKSTHEYAHTSCSRTKTGEWEPVW